MTITILMTGKKVAQSNVSVPIHYLRQHIFCPRIPYYELLLELKPTKPIWTKQGLTYEKIQQHLFKRRSLSRFNLLTGKLHFKVPLQDDELQLHGIMDGVIETNDEIFPVDFKLYNIKKGDIAQLTAYSMLASKHFNKKCNSFFIITGNSHKPYHHVIQEKEKLLVKQITLKIIANLRNGLKPNSSATQNQCSQCEYLNYCNDR
ncbi:MAG: CRISPR-associated protein Cas4 [Methylacidiphilales bacterium]|nr:CRISPR-associated protein Cas4 [Candidatus Methylacidiphilales bacterium]